MQKILKRVPWDNVFPGWLVILPVEWGHHDEEKENRERFGRASVLS